MKRITERVTEEMLWRHAKLSIIDTRELCRDEYEELKELEQKFSEEEEAILRYLAGQEDFAEVVR